MHYVCDTQLRIFFRHSEERNGNRLTAITPLLHLPAAHATVTHPPQQRTQQLPLSAAATHPRQQLQQPKLEALGFVFNMTEETCEVGAVAAHAAGTCRK